MGCGRNNARNRRQTFSNKHSYALETLTGDDSTGCGDACMAALVWAWLEEKTTKETALAGLAAGAIAMESAQTINPNMSADALTERMYL